MAIKTRVKVWTGSNLQHLKMICGSTVVDESCAHYCVSVCKAGKRQVASFDSGRWGNVKFLAKMPTVTAIHLRRPKAVLYPRWALGVRTKLGQSSLYDR